MLAVVRGLCLLCTLTCTGRRGYARRPWIPCAGSAIHGYWYKSFFRFTNVFGMRTLLSHNIYREAISQFPEMFLLILCSLCPFSPGMLSSYAMPPAVAGILQVARKLIIPRSCACQRLTILKAMSVKRETLSGPGAMYTSQQSYSTTSLTAPRSRESQYLF